MPAKKIYTFDEKKNKISQNKRLLKQRLKPIEAKTRTLGSTDQDNFFVYLSDTKYVRLNGKAGSGVNTIYCGDLAYFVFGHKIKTKKYKKHVSSIECIEKVGSMYHKCYYYSSVVFNDWNCYKAYSLKNFGPLLKEYAQPLQLNDTIALMMESENHMMCIAIQKREHYYKIKFYDPNKTNIHTNVVCKNINAIGEINLNTVLSLRKIKEYFPKYKVFILFSKINDLKTKTIEMPNIDRIPEQHLHYYLFYILKLNDVEKTETIVNKILNSGITNKAKFNQLKIMNGEHRVITESGSTTVHKQYLDAALTFLKSIINSTLLFKMKQDLLEVKLMTCSQQSDFCFIGCIINSPTHEQYCNQFFDIINTANITNTEKIEIFQNCLTIIAKEKKTLLENYNNINVSIMVQHETTLRSMIKTLNNDSQQNTDQICKKPKNLDRNDSPAVEKTKKNNLFPNPDQTTVSKKHNLLKQASEQNTFRAKKSVWYMVGFIAIDVIVECCVFAMLHLTKGNKFDWSKNLSPSQANFKNINNAAGITIGYSLVLLAVLIYLIYNRLTHGPYFKNPTPQTDMKDEFTEYKSSPTQRYCS